MDLERLAPVVAAEDYRLGICVVIVKGSPPASDGLGVGFHASAPLARHFSIIWPMSGGIFDLIGR